MIRVLFLSHGPMLYGAERSLLTLLSGINQEVITPYLLSPKEGPLTNEVKKLGIPVIILPIHHWVAFGEATKKSYFKHITRVVRGLRQRVMRIADVIKQNDIDLVYTNTVTFIEGALAARATKRPHLWHLREHVAGNKDLNPLLPATIISHVISAFSDHVIVNSQALEKAYIHNKLKNKISVIYNGIDIKSFQQKQEKTRNFRQELGIDPHTKLVTTVAAITPRKGHNNLIEAASKIQKSLGDVAFVIIGDGDKNFVDKLIKQVNDLGIENIFHFIGWRTDVEKILGNMDLMIVSAEQEAFGRTVVESMAAGVPVVSTRCGGPEEIIIDCKTGFLVPLKDAEKLADAAIKILSDTAIASSFSLEGQVRAQNMFSQEAYIASIEVILKKLTTNNYRKRNTQCKK